MCLQSGHMRATWQITLNLYFLQTTQVHKPNGKSICLAIFCTAYGRVSAGTPGHVLLNNNCSLHGRSGTNLIHNSFSPPESITQMASWLAQPFFAQITADCCYTLQWAYCSHLANMITGSIARSATCRFLIYSEADFEVFAPQGRHVAPIGVKFGAEEGTRGPLLRAKFHPNRWND